MTNTKIALLGTLLLLTIYTNAQNTLQITSNFDAGVGVNSFAQKREVLGGRFSGNFNSNVSLLFTTRDRYTFELGVGQSAQRFNIKDKKFAEDHPDFVAEIKNSNKYPNFYATVGYTRPITDRFYTYGKFGVTYNNVKAGSTSESLYYKKVDETLAATSNYVGPNIALAPEFGFQLKTFTGFYFHVGLKTSFGLSDILQGSYEVKNDGVTIRTDEYSSKATWLGMNFGMGYAILKSDKKEKKIKKVVEPIKEVIVEKEPEARPTIDLANVKLPERATKTNKRFRVKTNKVRLEIFDGAIEDGDTVSVKLNDNWILYEYGLTKTKKVMDIELKEGENTILLFAHNLGKIKPNTARIYVIEEKKKHIMTVRSDLGESGLIEILYEPKIKKGEELK